MPPCMLTMETDAPLVKAIPFQQCQTVTGRNRRLSMLAATTICFSLHRDVFRISFGRRMAFKPLKIAVVGLSAGARIITCHSGIV